MEEATAAAPPGPSCSSHSLLTRVRTKALIFTRRDRRAAALGRGVGPLLRALRAEPELRLERFKSSRVHIPSALVLAAVRALGVARPLHNLTLLGAGGALGKT